MNLFTNHEGDGGMKVLRVDPGMNSLTWKAGDAVSEEGSTNSYRISGASCRWKRGPSSVREAIEFRAVFDPID